MWQPDNYAGKQNTHADGHSPGHLGVMMGPGGRTF